jgi:hypothetical protein
MQKAEEVRSDIVQTEKEKIYSRFRLFLVRTEILLAVTVNMTFLTCIDTQSATEVSYDYSASIFSVLLILGNSSIRRVCLVLDVSSSVHTADCLCGLVVRVPGYRTEMGCVSCEVRTEFMYVM